MNIKILCQLAFLLALALGNSGCCTYLLVNSTHYQTQDTFNPLALYAKTNDSDTLALEGTRYNDATEHGLTNASHAFVVLPRMEGAIPFNTHPDFRLSADNVQALLPTYPGYIKTLKIMARQPAAFSKVADLPPNKISLVVQEHHPRRIRYVFVPFTLAADAATSPIQLICFGYLWWKFEA